MTNNHIKKKVVVDLYAWKEKGALGVVCMIAEETNCRWEFPPMAPFTFYTENTEQEKQVVDLINEFGIPITSIREYY